MIKAEYRNKYEAKEFIVEDFKWDNVKKIYYVHDMKRKYWLNDYLSNENWKKEVTAL